MRNLMAVLLVGLMSCTTSAQYTEGSAYAARVRLSDSSADCPEGQRGLFLTLAAAVLPKLLDQGFLLIDAHLKKIAAEYTTTYGAQAADVFYLQCKNEEGEPYLIPRFSNVEFGYGPVSGSGKPEDERFAKMGFTGRPSVYVNLEIIHMGDLSGRVIHLEVNDFVFNNPVAKRGNNKDLVLSLAFSFPTAVSSRGGTKGVTSNTVLPPIENLSPGIAISTNSISSDWIVMPEIEASELQQPNTGVLPFSVQITASETDRGSGSALWLHLAKAVSDSKSALSEVILEEITP